MSQTRKLLAAVLLGAAALAASTPPAAGAEAEWYTVEVLVFANLDRSQLAGEVWPLDPGRALLDGAVELATARDNPLPEPVAGNLFAFRLLEGGGPVLAATAARLRGSRDFRPLLHLAWRQPGYPRAESRPVRLRSDLPNPYARESAASLPPETGFAPAAPPLTVDGTLRVSRARFLHVEANLVYQRADASAPDAAAAVDPAGAAAAAPARFRLRESRRMRSGELHYLDHPAFGVLLQVSPYTPPAPEPVATPLDAAAQPAGPGSAAPAGGGATAPPATNTPAPR